jgi:ribonuclease HI
MNSIIIFTDGSSRGNPGPGGWAAIIVSQQKVVELGGNERHTTNNRMELAAAINALSFLKQENKTSGYDVVVNSDSSYVINGITKWVHGWQRKNWVTSQKEEVINRDLWEALLFVVQNIERENSKISWNYVGGHVGIAGNERCDEIATVFADSEIPELFNGPFSGYPIKDILNISSSVHSVSKKSASKSRSKTAAYSYVSFVDGKLNIDLSWKDCEKRVKGKKGARFKKSLNKVDEGAIVMDFTKKI